MPILVVLLFSYNAFVCLKLQSNIFLGQLFMDKKDFSMIFSDLLLNG